MSTNSSGVRRVFGVVASRWAGPILHCLSVGSLRPLELMDQIEGVSQKMLTQTLRRLESDGLVGRKVHAVVPPRVDYSLTPLGRAILEPVALVERWAETRGAEIDALEASRPGSKRTSTDRRRGART